MGARVRAAAAAVGLGSGAAAAGGLRLGEWGERLAAWAALEQERGRVFLFLPVAYGIGILLYFSAPDEPATVAPVLAAAGLALVAIRLRRRYLACLIATGLATVAAGFATATLRTAWLAHPVLAAETGFVKVTGWVEAVERREAGDRLTIAVTGTEPALAQPVRRLRVTSRGATGARVGAAVTFSARLRPPADAAAPGLYDFGRDAYFAGIGATGFTLGRVTTAEAGAAPLGVRLRAGLDDLRSAISRRIRAAIPGPTGAIADALVTGKRDGIPEALNEAMRAAGTYHILSISGFHMALVAALVFAMVRGSLALVPALALRHRVKAFAAVAALLVSSAYLVISGAEVATQRSWIMIAVVLVGVALDRGALTLRTLALSALLVLTLAPESLLGPSFQMSFAATLALVAGYGALRPWAEARAGERGGIGRALLALTGGVAGLAASSFVASLATTPYAAYHFHTIQFYGVPGNLLGAPIVEFVTMPLEILALLLWPFGWDRPVWAMAGLSLDLFVKVMEWVASWPGGRLGVPAFGPASLALVSLGLILGAALSTPLRWAGLPMLAAGLAMLPVAERPLVLVDAEAGTVAARAPDGRYRVLSPRPSRFTVQRWLQADADPRGSGDPTLVEGVACDALGCAMALKGGGRVAFARDAEALADDCREARLVVSRFPAPAGCAAAVLDLRALPWTGAVAVMAAAGDYRTVAAREGQGRRPWFRPSPAGEPPVLLALPNRAPQPAPAPEAAEAEETEEEPQDLR